MLRMGFRRHQSQASRVYAALLLDAKPCSEVVDVHHGFTCFAYSIPFEIYILCLVPGEFCPGSVVAQFRVRRTSEAMSNERELRITAILFLPVVITRSRTLVTPLGSNTCILVYETACSQSKRHRGSLKTESVRFRH